MTNFAHFLQLRARNEVRTTLFSGKKTTPSESARKSYAIWEADRDFFRLDEAGMILRSFACTRCRKSAKRW